MSRVAFKHIWRQKRLRHTGQINVKLPAFNRYDAFHDLEVGQSKFAGARLIDTQTGGTFEEDRRWPNRHVEQLWPQHYPKVSSELRANWLGVADPVITARYHFFPLLSGDNILHHVRHGRHAQRRARHQPMGIAASES